MFLHDLTADQCSPVELPEYLPHLTAIALGSAGHTRVPSGWHPDDADSAAVYLMLWAAV
ncbi:hypothetical protein [Nocardia farcinica]|uniref:hypothetical protein n=1 Tax=Nocardia farcinica TaxID=37329 RepID=UPI002453E430|nr:hypothetical protein [Nocardia farcinica]